MRNNNLFWGVTLVLLGVLMLFDRMRFFWPVILILVGLWVVLGGRWNRAQVDKSISIDALSARSAHVRVGFGAGKLHIDGAASAGKALDGIVNDEAHVTSQLDGDVLNVRLGNEASFPIVGIPSGFRWNLHLSKDLPLTLELKTGASSSSVDLSALSVSSLSVDTGASETEITLPATGHTHVEVRGGAAEIRLRIPQGVAARVRSRSGMAEVRVDENRFPRMGDVNQSADYESAPNRVDMLIEVGAASVRVM